MNLLQLRTKFRSLSGRFDLVNEDFSDNGADFFINEGRKYLDRLDETQKSWASCFRWLEIGKFSVSFPYCRAIKEVWAATTVARWQLEKVSLQDMTTDYLAGLPSSRNTGSPLYYAPCIARYIPENAEAGDIEAFAGFTDVEAGTYSHYNSVLVSVPASEKIMLDIRGLFYSMELVEDTDKNYWSEVHPLLLYMAAMRQIEVTNRNTQGVNDWTSSIRDEMSQIGMDLVEELIAEVNQMEG
jgi:hypothetical protein